jgi:hypothetical protein
MVNNKDDVALYSKSNPKGAKFQRKLECFNCGEDHRLKECPKPHDKKKIEDKLESFRSKKAARKEKASGKEKQGNASSAIAYLANVVHESANAACQDLSNDWYLDSGSSQDLTHSRESMYEYKNLQPCDKLCIETANGSIVEAKGVGTVNIVPELTSKKVYHVPGLKHNLLSIGRLQNAGFSVNFPASGDGAYIQKGDISVKVPRHGSIYRLTMDKSLSSMDSVAKARLWHRRFGHVGPTSLAHMAAHNCVKGMPIGAAEFGKLKQEICSSCIQGSMVQLPHKPTGNVYGIGELAHSDICVVDTPSLGMRKYMISYVFDGTSSHYSLVGFLQRKSQANDFLKKAITSITQQSSHKLRALRMDRGGEYLSEEFKAWLNDKGITPEYTVARS